MTDVKREDCRCGQRGRLWACGQIDCPWASKFFNNGRLTSNPNPTGKKPHTTYPWAVGARGRVFWTVNKRPNRETPNQSTAGPPVLSLSRL
jgi:hypothetical protein